MGPIEAAWHVLNFFAPALGVGIIASLAAKGLWRRELRAVSWLRLSLWACGGGALALVAGLAVFGRDGRMATYAAMLLAAAIALWWAGLPRKGR